MHSEPLAVTLLGGFLGAGKTTLLRNLLRTLRGHRVAVVVNDFGSLEIDADLIESVHEGVTRLKGGCMCCAVRESAVSTVLALAEQDPRPEHIIIEASGASDVGVLKQTFRELQRHQTVRLDALVTLVDAEYFDPRDKKLGLLQRCQVMAADLVLINKIDLVSPLRRAQVEASVLKIAPEARTWACTQAEVPQDILLGLHQQHGEPGPLAPFADQLLETRVLTQANPIEGHALVGNLATLPKAVYRLKGFVRLAERPQERVLVQVVAGRVHVQTQGQWSDDTSGALVAIGLRSEVDWAQVQRDIFG